MHSFARGLVVLAVTAAASWSLAATASAADNSGDPCEVSGSYQAPLTCKVLVEDVSATCTDDLSGANLDYALTVEGGLGAKSVDVTLTDTAGHTAAINGKPLSGSVAWPSNVNAANTTVTFTTTTATPYTVSTEVKTPSCISQVLADEGGSTARSAVLASTGSQVGPVLALSAGLLLVGGTTVLLVRRRRNAEH